MQTIVERSLWHPVLAADALPPDAPCAARLLGEELVLWRGAAGTPHAWADRCPHRGTRLSLGRVRRDGLGDRDGAGGARLECPYHGWQFDASGRCVAIPALPAFTPPASNRACTFEARQAYGLVWVRLGGDDVDRDKAGGMQADTMGSTDFDTALPAFAAEHDASLRKLLCGPYAVATSAPRIVENFLDLAHFGFVHDGWLGDRDHTALDDHRIEPTPHGFVVSGCAAWQPRSSRSAQAACRVEYRYELTAPFSAVLSKMAPTAAGAAADVAPRDDIALFVCPQDPEHSVVWFRLAVTDFSSSDAELRAFQDTIFAQDQPILESQQPRRLPLHGGELHCAADRSSAAYRRVLSARGIHFGVSET